MLCLLTEVGKKLVHSASDVLSLEESLEEVPLGDWMIVLVALGLVAAVWLFAKMARVGDFGDEAR